jgi:RNA polymerase sigma-70 factor (ECF subfamily)
LLKARNSRPLQKDPLANREKHDISTRHQDFDLIQRAQRGDSDAFAALFHAHKVRIYSLCLRMTDNVTEAEDLAQDAFLQVFRKLAGFRGESALSTWLYRIAINTVLMHFRRRSLCLFSLDELRDSHKESGPVRRGFGSRDTRLETSVARVSLIRALSELPEGYRAIFLLHEVEGYQHREIAELLGCSVGNSKSQLHKAKLRMRDFLTSPPQNQLENERVPRKDFRLERVPSDRAIEHQPQFVAPLASAGIPNAPATSETPRYGIA